MLMNTLKDDQLRYHQEVRSSLYSIMAHDNHYVFGGPSSGLDGKGALTAKNVGAEFEVKVVSSVNSPRWASASLNSSLCGFDELSKGFVGKDAFENGFVGEGSGWGPGGGTVTMDVVTAKPHYSVEYRPPPAPPHMFHFTEPPPSIPSYINTTEFSAQQVFEVIPDRNSVLINAAFNTTLPTGQTYYSIDTTTLDDGSKMISSVEYPNFDTMNFGVHLNITSGSGGGHGVFVSSQDSNNDEMLVDVYAKKKGVGDVVKKIENDRCVNGEGNEAVLIFDPGGDGHQKGTHVSNGVAASDGAFLDSQISTKKVGLTARWGSTFWKDCHPMRPSFESGTESKSSSGYRSEKGSEEESLGRRADRSKLEYLERVGSGQAYVSVDEMLSDDYYEQEADAQPSASSQQRVGKNTAGFNSYPKPRPVAANKYHSRRSKAPNDIIYCDGDVDYEDDDEDRDEDDPDDADFNPDFTSERLNQDDEWEGVDIDEDVNIVEDLDISDEDDDFLRKSEGRQQGNGGPGVKHARVLKSITSSSQRKRGEIMLEDDESSARDSGNNSDEGLSGRNKVALLDSELSSLAAEKSKLELQLKSAMEKGEVLNESLNGTTEENINMADVLNYSTEKLVEAENSLQLRQNELNRTHQKLGSTDRNLEPAGMREIEVLEKLKLPEELLEKHQDSEVKLQEVIANFNSKDFEVQALEEQVMIYKEQTMEAAERSASLKEEFAQIALRLANSENANEELKRRVSHTEDQAIQTFSEIDMLVETNTQLKSKIKELPELLNSEYTEKEETSQKLSSHLSTIMELNDRHSRASELADYHKFELEQTPTRLKELESMVKELENRSSHFGKECEGLAGVNFNLTQELSEHEFKLNVLVLEGGSDYISMILVSFLDERRVTFDLEDKVVLWERGIVMDWPNSVGLLNLKRSRPKISPKGVRVWRLKEGKWEELGYRNIV